MTSAHLPEIEKTMGDPSMAFAIYTPTPYIRGLKLPAAKIPLSDIRIGKQSKKVYMYIGGTGRGRFTGVGWTRAGKNLQNGQWMRMDWHDDHGQGDISDQGFHFHVRRLGED